MTEKILIDENKPLDPGDIIELHFRTYGGTYIKALQLAAIDRKLEGQPGFRILSWTLPTPQTVVFKVRIEQTNPIIVTAALIVGFIVVVGLVAWLVFDKVYQIIESPAGKIGVGGLGIFAAAAAVVAIVTLLPKK